MYHLNLEDVTCGHCAATVEKAVKAADPNAKVAVNLEAKTASIESEIGPDVFIAAIEDAGYRASLKKSCCSHIATSIDSPGYRTVTRAAPGARVVGKQWKLNEPFRQNQSRLGMVS